MEVNRESRTFQWTCSCLQRYTTLFLKSQLSCSIKMLKAGWIHECSFSFKLPKGNVSRVSVPALTQVSYTPQMWNDDAVWAVLNTAAHSISPQVALQCLSKVQCWFAAATQKVAVPCLWERMNSKGTATVPLAFFEALPQAQLTFRRFSWWSAEKGVISFFSLHKKHYICTSLNHIARTENHICVKDTKLANQVYLNIY